MVSRRLHLRFDETGFETCGAEGAPEMTGHSLDEDILSEVCRAQVAPECSQDATEPGWVFGQQGRQSGLDGFVSAGGVRCCCCARHLHFPLFCSNSLFAISYCAIPSNLFLA